MRISRSGFTLIEVAVAIMALAVAMTATLSVTAYGINEGQEIVTEATAPVAANAVLADAGWPSTWTPINIYEAKREVVDVQLPGDPNDTTITVPAKQVTVTLRSRGREVMTLVTYQRER